MPSFFKRARSHRTDQEPENLSDRRLDRYYADRVPASARSPELARLISLPDDEETDPDAPDEDVEFFASLVKEVERKPAAETPRTFPAPHIEHVIPAPTEEEKLNVFRQMQDEETRVRTAETLGVEDADLDDLLEELSTTAAALRLRRAA
jgi:hypothetical protein